jgi:hypothetical protein
MQLADDVEGAAPAGAIEDVEDDVADEGDAVAHGGLVGLLGGGVEGPVDEHRAAHDVFLRDEAPVAAVEAFGAVVAHGEDVAGRNDEVVALDVRGEVLTPELGELGVGAGRDGGEVVAVGIVGVVEVAVFGGHAGVGFGLGDSVEVNDAVAEVDVIAGEADGTLDEDEVRGFGVRLVKDDDVTVLDGAVVDEGCPFGGRREGGAVDNDVVADEEGLLHGGGGDFEVLEDEPHDEEADDEDGADGGEGLERGLGGLGCKGLAGLGVFNGDGGLELVYSRLCRDFLDTCGQRDASPEEGFEVRPSLGVS